MITVDDIFKLTQAQEKAETAAKKASAKALKMTRELTATRITYIDENGPTNVIYENGGKRYFFDGYYFTEING